MEPQTNELFKWAVGQGGIAVAFIVLFHFYRKDVQSYTALWKTQSEQLLLVVKENTAAVTKLTSVVEDVRDRE